MDAWFRAIEHATTAEEIVAQARDFCSLMHPRDLAALPEDVRTIRIDSRDDIARLRERLEACGASARAKAFDAQQVSDLLTYIDRATARLGEFSGPH